MAEKVVVSAYDPEWVSQYEEEKEKILAAANDICLSIEHIGSTSVPGLGAKPVIDIMIGVGSLEQVEQRHINRLGEIGYEYVHKPDFPERKFFRKGEWRAGTHHLHVYAMNSANWRDQLLFRDYLRKHEDTLAQYCRLKKELELKFKNDRVSYTKGKESFIREVINRANNE